MKASTPPDANQRIYCLFDANVIAAYYLPKSHKNPKVSERVTCLVESVRSGKCRHFLYIPNICIAEVFSTFCKYTYGGWNQHVKGTPIDSRIHESLRNQFSHDLHNGKLFYHYELARYHVLGINMVAAIDHYYALGKTIKGKKVQRPAGTFDQLIVSMGLQLVKIHGSDRIVLITADQRLAKLVERCRKDIPVTPRNTMRIEWIERFCGVACSPKSFPQVLNLNLAKDQDLRSVFGEWPLPMAARYRKPYQLKSGNRQRLV